MADISKEIQSFREAEYGEEVRGSMISLAQKVNTDGEVALQKVEKNIKEVESAITRSDAAAAAANVSAHNANVAAANADNTRVVTDQLRTDLQKKLESDYWRGSKGDKGDRGAPGISASTSGMFSLYLDPNTGDLYAEYPDGETPPAFEYDAKTGNLYYVTG